MEFPKGRVYTLHYTLDVEEGWLLDISRRHLSVSARTAVSSSTPASRSLFNSPIQEDQGKGPRGPGKGAASIQYTKRDVEVGEMAGFGETKFCVVRVASQKSLSMRPDVLTLTPICVMWNV
jgi:hypothetical protein